MEPGVPFALLGAAVLLAVAAWTGLAATAVVRAGLRRGGAGPAALLVAGALVLAVVDSATGTGFGRASSDLLAGARAGGLLLLAAGLGTGALARVRRSVPPAPPAVPAIVVPLAAAPAPALLAAAAGVVAALAALRARRDGVGVLLALGLVVAAGAAGAAPLAGTATGALVVVLLRGGSALLLLAALVVLARASVLGKVVAAILAGVLVMATAAVAVVGTVVADATEREQASLVSDASLARLQLLEQELAGAQAFSRIAAPLCTGNPGRCDEVLEDFAPPRTGNFALAVPATGTPVVLGGRAPLTPAEALGLAGGPAVALALEGGPNQVVADGLPTAVRLVGAPPALALVVVVPGPRSGPTGPADSAFVYGVRLDDRFAGGDVELGGFGYSLLVGDQVVASNRSERERAVVEQAARSARVGSGVPVDGVTVPAEGQRPTVHFRPVSGIGEQVVGTLALTRDAEAALGPQREALQALLLTVLVTTAAVGGLALLAGRRTVDPLRRLTVAASRVAAGDLAVRTGIDGRDEVGTLSRTFDAMTGSVARLTGDLRATASRLETVLSSMTDGLVATDARGRVTSINRAAVMMTGLPDEQSALGLPLAEVIDVRVDGVPLHLDADARPDVDAAVHPYDGDPVPVRAALAPLDDGQGMVLLLRDTRREREVERMKTEFLSNVSHELRTPLTPIRGYADLLASRPGLPAERVTTFAATILSESLKMNRVVDLLVDVAAIEAGRVTTSPRAVAPADLVDARLAAWRDRDPQRAGDLRRKVAGRLPAVCVDPAWLGKAVDELVDNALKHTPPGTPVTLVAALAPSGDRVRLAVRDAGPGIKPEHQALLFTSFEQVDGSATRRVGGLGLGLSFVRRLADDSGYPLSVVSAVGRGSEFALDLPLAEAASTGGSDRGSPSPGRRAPFTVGGACGPRP